MRKMLAYTRLYSDDHGESHFTEVEIDLEWADYAPPAPMLERSSTTSAKQFGFMNAPAGWSSDWHPSTARNFFFVITGEWEVTASDGEARRFTAGSALLVEDTTGKVIRRALSASQNHWRRWCSWMSNISLAPGFSRVMTETFNP
jgi:hypothetical protein